MKKFSFSLETLLKERVRAVEKTQKEMAPIVSRYNKIHDQEQSVAKTLSSNLFPSIVGHSYFRELGEVYRSLQEEKRSVEKELQKWQETLAQRIKDRKVLEIIKEKRFREWQKNFNKKIEKSNEELVLNFF